MLQDRRHHTRQLITPPPYVALNSSTSGGILTDVSEGGMALNLLGPPVSDDVLLELNLAGTDEHFQTKGRITWTKDSERRVGLKFVDLTESSLLQIKKWLAISPVTMELKQNLQSERNEPGTNVPDTESAEAADSPAIALNHEEVETKTRPIELRSIDMAGSTKEVDPQDTESKAVRDANPNAGLHTEREEPVRNAPETQTLEALRGPALTSDRSAGSLPGIKESFAKKSGTAELQKVRSSSWVNDGARVKVKTLEALLTEAPIQADISKPAPRRERKEPVTHARQTQLTDAAPRTPSIGMLPSDRLLQKKTLAKSSVPADLEQNFSIPDRGKNSSSVQHRERQPENIAEPSALGNVGVSKTTSAEADVEEPNAVFFAAPSHGLQTEKNVPTTIEQAVRAPKFPTSLTAASEQRDNLAQTLRTSFAQSELRHVRAPSLKQKTEEAAVDRVLHRWILAALVVFLLIVSLAAARRILHFTGF